MAKLTVENHVVWRARATSFCFIACKARSRNHPLLVGADDGYGLYLTIALPGKEAAPEQRRAGQTLACRAQGSRMSRLRG
jgi:hypothetical protein